MTVEPRHPRAEVASLIVWLDRSGNAALDRIQPGSGKRRIVDLRPGDTLYHHGRPRRIVSLEAYREHRIEAESVEHWRERNMGYVLPAA